MSVIDIAPPEAVTAAAGKKSSADLEVRVRSMKWEAPGVLSLDLTAPDLAPLPAFTPGSHIDLHLPNGVMRQYSLCGNPGDTSCYRIAIRSVGGGLSSQFVHRKLRPGELLTISLPRNNFDYDDAENYLFIAGGIGITPLIPMVRAAAAAGKPWTLLYCNQRDDEAPFLGEIAALGGTLSLHSSAAGTRLDAATRLAAIEADTLVYCCGPERLMLAVEQATAAWPVGSVRFEWFAPRSRPEDETAGSFEVVCQASGVTLTVPPEKTVLATLNDAGIFVPCSCEQGICGTCEVRVLGGEVDHRDSIQSQSERAANQSMMVCVSRARTPQLLLDI